MIAVQGPNAREKCWAAIPGLHASAEALPAFGAASIATISLRAPATPARTGSRSSLPRRMQPTCGNNSKQLGVTPLRARRARHLAPGSRHGALGQDMDATVTPYEAGLGWTVDTRGQRDFIGRAALAARSPRYALVGLVLLDPGVLRAHKSWRPRTARDHDERLVCADLGRSIAFARLPTATGRASGCESNCGAAPRARSWCAHPS